MTAENFSYWLQGFFEITGEVKQGLTPEQTIMIQKHLHMVFIHDIDPKMGNKDHQDKLNTIHNKSVSDFPTTEEEAIFKFGPKPAPGYELSYLHGWYDPTKGSPRC